MPFLKNPSSFYVRTYGLASPIQAAFLLLHSSSGILTISHLNINVSKGFSLLSRDLLKCMGSGSASVRLSCRVCVWPTPLSVQCSFRGSCFARCYLIGILFNSVW